MAMNKQAIVDAVFQGAASVAKNPIPPTMWSYNDKSRTTNTIRTLQRRRSKQPASVA